MPISHLLRIAAMKKLTLPKDFYGVARLPLTRLKAAGTKAAKGQAFATY
jgi:hypothetical protein